eukprot:COSAG02_NODE_556_length_20390_cov_88.575230_12_plen_159_part_00
MPRNFVKFWMNGMYLLHSHPRQRKWGHEIRKFHPCGLHRARFTRQSYIHVVCHFQRAVRSIRQACDAVDAVPGTRITSVGTHRALIKQLLTLAGALLTHFTNYLTAARNLAPAGRNFLSSSVNYFVIKSKSTILLGMHGKWIQISPLLCRDQKARRPS